MKILITGCNGFLGGSLGRFAAQAGHEVLGVARASQPAGEWPGRYTQADVAHADLAAAVREFQPDMVFHGAGTASVAGSLTAPMDDLRAAAMTWANVLDGVRRSGLRPMMIFPSSAAVYGNPQRLPVSEDFPVAPISPYGFHKAACELLAREYATCFGLHVVVGRVFSVYGPAQRRLLVWELAEQFLHAESVVWLQGTGEETRDYLYVDDLAAAVLEIAVTQSSDSNGGRYECVNLASGQQITTMELAERLRRMMAPEKAVLCRGLSRPGDPRHWQADVNRLHEMAPGHTKRTLQSGLLECLRTWRPGAPRADQRDGVDEFEKTLNRLIA